MHSFTRFVFFNSIQFNSLDKDQLIHKTNYVNSPFNNFSPKIEIDSPVLTIC